MNQPATDHPSIDSFTDRYWFLSNFYRPAPVTLGRWKLSGEEITYTSSEYAFQAAKSLDLETRKIIAAAPTPGWARKLGRDLNLKSFRRDWESVKVDVMHDILREKFATSPLREWLTDTYPVHLEEGNLRGDVEWGTVSGRGLNLLGKLLMQVRDEILDNA